MTDEHTATPHHARRRGMKRVLDAYSGEHAVYGLVLVTALVAVGWEDETDLEVLIFVVGTVFVFWLAHIYAAVVSSRAAQPAPPLRSAIVKGVRHASGMLVAMLVPALLLLLGATGVVEEYTAYFLALGSGVVLLAVIGWANAVRNGSPLRWRIAGTLATTALGVLVIVLSILVH
ncbi:hypothetical protein [Microbacterium yannicii]|uniref:hypothetical protein n=1 Tax=Microbacterium yannicii TaxID=671622 RepID=UPI0002E5EE81|nr:hypothetical protein [Microbacterium yannicii]